MTTRKMIALTFLRVLPRSRSDWLLLLMYVDPVIPIATAAMRVMWMRCLLAVILEIGFFITDPLRVSLRKGIDEFARRGDVGGWRGLPVEDEGVRGVEQTEESNAVDDLLPDAQPQALPSTIRACEGGPHHERSHSNWDATDQSRIHGNIGEDLRTHLRRTRRG